MSHKSIFRMRRSAGSELDDSPVLLSYIDDGSPTRNYLDLEGKISTTTS